MRICHCNIDLDAYLHDIPFEWREGIVKALCFVLDQGSTSCTDIKKCETRTSLSPFKLEGNTLSVQYTDEHGIINTSSIDISEAIDNALTQVDPKCLITTGPSPWPTMSNEERLQLIIDAYCGCCPPTTTTSTTSTTTQVPCLTYFVNNSDGSFDSFIYYACDGTFTIQPLDIGDGMEVCAIEGTVSAPGAIVTEVDSVCSTTTSTTSTSTTSTSTSTSTTSTTSTSTTSTTTLAAVPCNTPTTFVGGPTYPSIREIVLGSGTGIVTLTVDAFNIPDKFIVVFDGIEVINTGYRGSAGYQSALNAQLASMGMPPETITGGGTGTFTFNKTTATTSAFVKVFAPLPMTQWNYTLGCAVPTTTTSTTTSTSTSTTSTTTVAPATTTSTTTVVCANVELHADTAPVTLEWLSCSGIHLSLTLFDTNPVILCTNGQPISVTFGAITITDTTPGDC